jgi:hypothetical protein
MSFETISLLLNWLEMGALFGDPVSPLQHIPADRQYSA